MPAPTERWAHARQRKQERAAGTVEEGAVLPAQVGVQKRRPARRIRLVGKQHVVQEGAQTGRQARRRLLGPFQEDIEGHQVFVAVNVGGGGRCGRGPSRSFRESRFICRHR